MTVYKNSDGFRKIRNFAGIIFDCDGVLIDSSRSYDLALIVCFRAFSALLGFDFQEEEFMKTLREIRKLGGFNNDWDSLDIMVAYSYSKSKDTKLLDSISQIPDLRERLQAFETKSNQAKGGTRLKLEFGDLLRIVSKMPEGTNREELSTKILRTAELLNKVSEMTSYPRAVGEGLLATLYDEVVYGKQVFRKMYGFDCATSSMSSPGLILQEKKLVSESALAVFSEASQGNLGVITGRPKIPTLFTLGKTFSKWFTRPEICMFTGDYLLNVEEVKPSPKPMFRISRILNSSNPILYVGDSGEDVLLAKYANMSKEMQQKVAFAGIASDMEKARYFESEGNSVDCIVSDVNELSLLIAEKCGISSD
ncbi:MAG: HAD family hydrolase [Nitrososphaerota archaeon]|nr:HAD family hydrolase [Nitrososphaerota archaeon]